MCIYLHKERGSEVWSPVVTGRILTLTTCDWIKGHMLGGLKRAFCSNTCTSFRFTARLAESSLSSPLLWDGNTLPELETSSGEWILTKTLLQLTSTVLCPNLIFASSAINLFFLWTFLKSVSLCPVSRVQWTCPCAGSSSSCEAACSAPLFTLAQTSKMFTCCICSKSTFWSFTITSLESCLGNLLCSTAHITNPHFERMGTTRLPLPLFPLLVLFRSNRSVVFPRGSRAPTESAKCQSNHFFFYRFAWTRGFVWRERKPACVFTDSWLSAQSVPSSICSVLGVLVGKRSSPTMWSWTGYPGRLAWLHRATSVWCQLQFRRSCWGRLTLILSVTMFSNYHSLHTSMIAWLAVLFPWQLLWFWLCQSFHSLLRVASIAAAQAARVLFPPHVSDGCLRYSLSLFTVGKTF